MCTPTTGPSFWRTSLTKPGRREDLALAVAAEVVLVRLDGVGAVLLARLRLRDAHRGDLGVAVGHPRDAGLDDRRRLEAGDLLGDEDALLEPAVRELQPRHDVADGVHVRHVGPQPLVGEDEPAVHPDADLFVAEAGGVRAPADGDEQDVGLDRLAGLQAHGDAVVGLLGARRTARRS